MRGQAKGYAVKTTKQSVILLAAAFAFTACAKPTPLTEQKAALLVKSQMFDHEPVYAEVPQKVWFGPKAPKDDFDELSLRTLEHLKSEGLVTTTESHTPDGTTTVQAKVTKKGFHILGTMPSARGPVYRAKICEKKVDGVRNFIRHPSDPTVGRAEIVWHYDNPTPMYPFFETKMNKPLKKPFASLAAFHWEKGSYRVELIVKKTDVE
jgi:hypothetical protein